MTNNEAQSRFERIENGLLAFADYRAHYGRYVVTHVEADPALRGTGAASRLMEDIVAFARANDARIVPRCSYAVAWFKRHKDTADIIG